MPMWLWSYGACLVVGALICGSDLGLGSLVGMVAGFWALAKLFGGGPRD
jgi:hypothetical protein